MFFHPGEDPAGSPIPYLLVGWYWEGRRGRRRKEFAVAGGVRVASSHLWGIRLPLVIVRAGGISGAVIHTFFALGLSGVGDRRA